ncbi:MAG TPA: RluA family pseudouridine synthase [Chlamydiales bacterium]|nr:RluA family pseudouridine synthase [Chlamydiales bacterium]HPE85307.1 RluA family pseudouridine synthase [Chlamydiales bacterium]
MEYTVKEAGPLLEQLGFMAPDSSKTTLRSWLKLKRVQVNGKIAVIPSQIVESGALVTLGTKNPKRLSEGLKILYEDSDFIVVDKPAELLSVETQFEKHHTAHDILKRYTGARVYPVHRLDKKTRGVMVFALSLQAFQGLKEQFKDHSIHREYRARVEGIVEPDKGTIRLALKEDAAYRVHVDETGEMAITHFEVLQRHKNTTYLKLLLETGKKNQIRVHLKHMGHPILGDRKYGSTHPGKLALHACILGFVHPVTGKQMEFISP